MIQFLKNIWHAQRNAELLDVCRFRLSISHDTIRRYSWTIFEIAKGNIKNTNGTVRKHIRSCRKALGLEE